MTIRHVLISALLVLALGGCAKVAKNLNQAAYDVTQDAKETGLKFKEYVSVPVKQPSKIQPLKPTYCYRVMQDVVCYGEPQPGAENRLVSYQGPAETDAAASVPTYAKTPVPRQQAFMAAPVTAVASASPGNAPAASQPAAGLPPLKPMFVGAPPEVASDGLGATTAGTDASQGLF